MVFSKERRRGRDLREQFNRLVNDQTRDDLLDRIAELGTTETGQMFFDLMAFLKVRISPSNGEIETTHARVILGIEQVERTTIPYLVREPAQMHVLAGMLASLNTDIWMARSSTCRDALLRHERGYPQEVGAIAAFIDKALGLDKRRARIRKGAPNGAPLSPQGVSRR
jgi:hypothetical protein